MSRWFTAGVLTASLSGCIIYERNYVPIGPCEDEWCTETGTADPGGPPGTQTGEPGVTDGVRLTVTEAYPGDTILSFLVPNEEGVDIATVESLWFERDVQVLDDERRIDEIVLLLAVSPNAEPGDVEVYLTTAGGGGWILAEPFHILGDDTTSGGTTGGTAGTGTGGTGTGTTGTGGTTP